MEIFTKTKINYNDEICCICQQIFKHDENVYSCIRCKKNIHIECTKKLLEFKNECPNCRYKYDHFDNLDLVELMIFSNQIVDINHTMMEIAIFMNLLKYFSILLIVIVILILFYFFYF